MTAAEEAKRDRFIKKNGVTECPKTQSPEFIKMCQERDERYNNMTLDQKWKAGLSMHRPKIRKLPKKKP